MATVGAPALQAPVPSVLRRAAGVLSEPRRALLVAVVILSAVVGLDALSDPDVWWHMVLGNWTLAHGQIPQTDMLSYTVNGVPLAPHEWFSGVLFAGLNNAGGLFLLALVMGAVSWIGLIAVAVHGRIRGAGPVTIAIGLALGAKAAQPVLGIRPQVFTFAFLAITLLLTEVHLRKGGRAIWALPPLYMLWANLHGGFVAGIAFMGLAAGVAVVGWYLRLPNHVPLGRPVSLGIVAIGCALFACVNPQGLASYRFALSEATSEGSKGIIEWQPPSFADPGLWSLLALVIAFVALGAYALRRRRLAARDAILGVVACGSALLAVRNTAVAVAVVTPMIMGWAADALKARPPRLIKPRPLTAGAVLAGGLIVTLAAGGLGLAVSRLQASAAPSGVAAVYPACATSVLERAPTTQLVFTAYANGGYVAYRLWPHGYVYIYGASDAFTKADFLDYYRIASGATTSPTAVQLLESSGTTAVLYPTGALTRELARAPGWTRVLTDHGTVLLLRDDPSWAAGATCSP
ncbi:MAG: hypothetical protein JOZ75_09700 [Candidatus Dormibacteraeota bacterium]|nr:hypothetical protein [Candidatus Dormibacteraeota bacterium]